MLRPSNPRQVRELYNELRRIARLPPIGKQRLSLMLGRLGAILATYQGDVYTVYLDGKPAPLRH